MNRFPMDGRAGGPRAQNGVTGGSMPLEAALAGIPFRDRRDSTPRAPRDRRDPAPLDPRGEARVPEGVLRNAAQSEARRVGQRIAGELEEAFEAVLPRIAALVGEGFERKAFKVEMARYLLEQGVPAQAVCAMSRGYELELCTKAMLFDRMQSRRKEAEAKLDDLPAVQSPRRAGLDEGDKLGRARAALNKNPNSTEALAALFAAM